MSRRPLTLVAGGAAPIEREEARAVVEEALALGRGYIASGKRCADTAEAYETLACLAVMRDELEEGASETLLRALEKCYFSTDPALRAYRAATTIARGNVERSRRELARTLAKMDRR